jgi:cell division GTPase FtsZ
MQRFGRGRPLLSRFWPLLRQCPQTALGSLATTNTDSQALLHSSAEMQLQPGGSGQGVVTKPFEFEGNVDSLIVVLNEKLLEGIDLSGARGVLVLIAAGKSTFKLSESRNAMHTPSTARPTTKA